MFFTMIADDGDDDGDIDFGSDITLTFGAGLVLLASISVCVCVDGLEAGCCKGIVTAAVGTSDVCWSV